MQGLKRKLVFITTYEIIGWTISSLGLALLSGNSAGVTGPLALVITTIAVSWNFIFNTLFEFWESRRLPASGHSAADWCMPFCFS